MATKAADSVVASAVISAATTLVDALATARKIVTGNMERVRKGDWTLKDRVVLYAEVNPINKDIKKMRDALNKDIKEEMIASCEMDPKSGEYTLRDSKEGLLSQNDKGSIFLRHGKSVVELRPVVKEVLIPEAATALFEEKGLLDAVQTERVSVTDPERLIEAIKDALHYLKKLEAYTPAGELESALEESTSKTTALSEEAISELIGEGRLEVDEIVPLYQTTYDYKLYEK